MVSSAIRWGIQNLVVLHYNEHLKKQAVCAGRAGKQSKGQAHGSAYCDLWFHEIGRPCFGKSYIRGIERNPTRMIKLDCIRYYHIAFKGSLNSPRCGRSVLLLSTL